MPAVAHARLDLADRALVAHGLHDVAERAHRAFHQLPVAPGAQLFSGLALSSLQFGFDFLERLGAAHVDAVYRGHLGFEAQVDLRDEALARPRQDRLRAVEVGVFREALGMLLVSRGVAPIDPAADRHLLGVVLVHEVDFHVTAGERVVALAVEERDGVEDAQVEFRFF